MDPFAIKTNSVIGEWGHLVKVYQANGNKYIPADSLIFLNLLDSFNMKSKETLKQLDNLKTFDHFDLRKPSIKYVESISRVMELMLNESLTHNVERQKTMEEFNKIIDTWKTDLVTAKKDFDQVQSNFKEEFKIE